MKSIITKLSLVIMFTVSNLYITASDGAAAGKKRRRTSPKTVTLSKEVYEELMRERDTYKAKLAGAQSEYAELRREAEDITDSNVRLQRKLSEAARERDRLLEDVAHAQADLEAAQKASLVIVYEKDLIDAKNGLRKVR